jgi:processive 1,2-diacylglycerol beta-glucosyltransferase
VKRLLLLSATSGNGHVAAAEAVAAALAGVCDDVDVRHVDLLDLMAPPLRILGRQGYMACVTYWPGLWRAVYRMSDGGGPIRVGPIVADVLAGGLMRLVRSWAPDRILSTYWAPAALHRWIPRSNGHRIPLSTVITDADLHVAWFQPRVDVYYVSDDSIRDRLAEKGFPRDRVVVSGIPAHPRFRPLSRRTPGRLSACARIDAGSS